MLDLDTAILSATKQEDGCRKKSSMLSFFSDEILFSRDPKLNEPGFRWANQKLVISRLSDDDKRTCKVGCRDNDGLRRHRGT